MSIQEEKERVERIRNQEEEDKIFQRVLEQSKLEAQMKESQTNIGKKDLKQTSKIVSNIAAQIEKKPMGFSQNQPSLA